MNTRVRTILDSHFRGAVARYYDSPLLSLRNQKAQRILYLCEFMFFTIFDYGDVRQLITGEKCFFTHRTDFIIKRDALQVRAVRKCFWLNCGNGFWQGNTLQAGTV